MKLIFCPCCNDIVTLRYEYRTCFCGKSAGKYVDNLNAVYSGEAIPLGILNGTFFEAVVERPESGLGTKFTAFVIPVHCETFIKIDEKSPSAGVVVEITKTDVHVEGK